MSRSFKRKISPIGEIQLAVNCFCLSARSRISIGLRHFLPCQRRKGGLISLTAFLMAGKISSLLDVSRIALHVQSTKRTAALNEVAQQLKGHPDVLNFDGFYAELLARDRLDTTCLGNGIALPHARTEHVKNIVLAVGRSDTGILFEQSKETVHLLFMLGTPKTKPGDYLLVVSALCR